VRTQKFEYRLTAKEFFTVRHSHDWVEKGEKSFRRCLHQVTLVRAHEVGEVTPNWLQSLLVARGDGLIKLGHEELEAEHTGCCS